MLLMLNGTWQNPTNRQLAINTWYECVLALSAQSSRCQDLAGNIANLKIAWSAEVIISTLGIITFTMEITRR